MLNHLRPIINKSIRRKFTSGGTIIYQGEAPRSACVLVKGVVRVYSISAQGDEQIVTFHVPGEFFPSSWIFSKAPSALFFYEAITDAEVAFIPRAELIEYLQSTPERQQALLDYFTTSYTASLIRVNALEQPKARDKLIYTMYFLCQRYAKDVENKKRVTIPIALTHQNLASLVGLTRETTAMEMSKLKKQGIISYKQQHYTIYLQKLFDLIGEDSFRKLSISDY